MRFFLLVLFLGVFAVFWLISTPVYFLYHVLLWLDFKLSKVIDDLFEGIA